MIQVFTAKKEDLKYFDALRQVLNERAGVDLRLEVRDMVRMLVRDAVKQHLTKKQLEQLEEN